MILQALRQGIVEAFRRPKIALALYALNLAVAAVLAVPAAALLDDAFGYSAAAADLDTVFGFEILIDFLGSARGALADHARTAGVAALLYAIVSSVLLGGIIDVLKGPPRSPFLPRLLGGAGRLAPRFLRLLVYLAAALVALHWIGRTLDLLLMTVFDQSHNEIAAFWAMRAKQALMLAALLFLAVLFDLARILTVIEDRVHMIGALLTAAGFAARHAGGLLLLYAAVAAAHLALLSLYVPAAHRWLPAGSIVFLLIVQQTLVLLRHVLRVAGIAALLAYYRGMTGAPAAGEDAYAGAAPAGGEAPGDAGPAGAGAAAPEAGGGVTPAGPAGGVRRARRAGAALVACAGVAALLVPVAGAGRSGTESAAPAPGARIPGAAVLRAAVPEPRAAARTAGAPLSRRVVAYDIEARLLPETRTIDGRGTIVYRNDSRSPIREMKLHLYANAFSNSASTHLRGIAWDDDPTRERLERTVREGTWGHLTVREVRDGDGADLTAATAIDETILTVPLPRPVPPGGSVTLRIAWETLLPRTFHRMGWWGEHYDVMQWYPKPAVWTDAGWKIYPFHYHTEFFADFGIFRVALTVPSRYRVEATGVPVDERANPDGTRTVTYHAEDVHDFAWIADPHAVIARHLLAEGPYAGAPVEILYVHRPDRAGMAPRILEAARHGLLYYGERYGPYPYPRLVIDDLPMGLGGGMEYPMLFTVSMAAFLPGFYVAPEELTLHEFGHQYWYGLVATNEFEEPWLDEGINSYVTDRAMRALRPPRPGRTVAALSHYAAARLLHEGVPFDLGPARLNLDRILGFRHTPFRPTEGGFLGYPISPFVLDLPGLGEGGFVGAKRAYAANGRNDPIATPSWGFHPGSYSATVYDKTHVALETVARLIGHDTLDRALGEYVRRFRFAHPTGRDFFAVLQETAARERPERDVAALIGPLFYGTATIDFAVTALRSREISPPRGLLPPARAGQPPEDRRPAPEARGGAARYETEVIVKRLGTAPLPVEVLVRFEDGSEARERWDGAGVWRRWTYEREARAVSAVADPDGVYAMDLDRNNNGRLRERRVRPVARLGLLWMFWLQNYLHLAAALA